LSDEKSEGLRAAALFYHEHPKPGKLEIRATKPLANGRDLSRAYSPGVAEASLEIKADPANAARYTARGNLVAVVSNGSAVLGLGNIGALASKPVMEGKAVLFKKFANIDCFDLEVDERTPKNWPISSARWSPPSAPSTSKTSRRPIVSSSNEFAGSG
jgi:malate dehydrogenase (oxaloacetate-decarboxylating)(NADP+)